MLLREPCERILKNRRHQYLPPAPWSATARPAGCGAFTLNRAPGPAGAVWMGGCSGMPLGALGPSCPASDGDAAAAAGMCSTWVDGAAGLRDRGECLLPDALHARVLIPDFVRHRAITHDARLPGQPHAGRLRAQPRHAVRAVTEPVIGDDLARAAFPGPSRFVRRGIGSVTGLNVGPETLGG